MSPTIADIGPSRIRGTAVVASFVALLALALASFVLGPAQIDPRGALLEVLDQLPFVTADSGLSVREAAIVWQLRVPRTALAALVGATLAVAGSAYQGVFRNPLADPYLLGVAAGAGLGATIAIVTTNVTTTVPPYAFVGGAVAVVASYGLARLGRESRAGVTLILSGVAVAAFFTALQTFVLQQNTQTFRQVFSWILGRLSTTGWAEVRLLLPYALVSWSVLFAHRRHLDVFAVGEEEAGSLGMNVGVVRLIVVVSATIGTAAAVSVSGLIGFVGIVVPHIIRLIVGPSYRRLVPLAIIGGAAFLVGADLVSRTLMSGGELPIGVVTAFIGAPFFGFVLATSGRGR